MTRDLSESEREAVRANASGEHVFCGDDAGAKTIASSALDAWDDLSDAAQEEAIRIARTAWEASR